MQTKKAGPLVIHPILYFLPDVFYGGGAVVQHSKLQKYVYAMVMAHFAKRELETVLYVAFGCDGTEGGIEGSSFHPFLASTDFRMRPCL
jgi:hypothetical protein